MSEVKIPAEVIDAESTSGLTPLPVWLKRLADATGTVEAALVLNDLRYEVAEWTIARMDDALQCGVDDAKKELR